VVADEVVADEVVADEVVADEVVADEVVADEVVADEAEEELKTPHVWPFPDTYVQLSGVGLQSTVW
jgi:hypothetical protein